MLFIYGEYKILNLFYLGFKLPKISLSNIVFTHIPTYKQQHLEKHKISHAPAHQENNNIKQNWMFP
jgi:hypothetical protein